MVSNTSPTCLSWTVHPLWDHGVRTVLLAAVLILVLALVRLTYPEPIWTILAAVVLFASLARYFFPTTYRLTQEGVEMTFLGMKRLRPWSEIRSYYPGPTGLLLSPFPKPHRLENFRGHYLLFGSHREEVTEFVRAHVAGEPVHVGED